MEEHPYYWEKSFVEQEKKQNIKLGSWAFMNTRDYIRENSPEWSITVQVGLSHSLKSSGKPWCFITNYCSRSSHWKTVAMNKDWFSAIVVFRWVLAQSFNAIGMERVWAQDSEKSERTREWGSDRERKAGTIILISRCTSSETDIFLLEANHNATLKYDEGSNDDSPGSVTTSTTPPHWIFIFLLHNLALLMTVHPSPKVKDLHHTLKPTNHILALHRYKKIHIHLQLMFKKLPNTHYVPWMHPLSPLNIFPNSKTYIKISFTIRAIIQKKKNNPKTWPQTVRGIPGPDVAR